MDLSIHNRALMRGLLAGAVVFAGVSACSRPDRTETGRDNTAAVSPDSASTQADNSAVTPPASDSASVAGVDTGSTSSTGTATVGSTTPPSKTTTPQRSIRDTSAAGYRSMERDTTTEPSAPTDTARATTDSALTPDGQSAVTPTDRAPMEVATPTTADTSTAQDMSADTSAAGYVNIAQDTSAAPAQADSGVAMEAGVDTTGTDSSATEVGAVSADADVAADSTEVRGEVRIDSTTAVASADSVTESEPIRPAEDSTEVYGAAALGGNVNAADAVVVMTRQGAQCIVVGPETTQGVLVEMSDTPASLNPCGLGSMILSRIWTRIE